MLSKKYHEMVGDAVMHGGSDALDGASADEVRGVKYAAEYIAEALASAFQADNPRFNRLLFLERCGVL